MELLKGFMRKCLGKDIYQYVLGRKIMKFNLFLLNIITYKVISNINIFGMRVRN